MLNAFASLKCSKKCLHQAQKPKLGSTLSNMLPQLAISRKFVARLVERAGSNTATTGPFIREKIIRGLHKTRTPRIKTYKWYKIYAHGLFNPRLAQAAVYPGRGVLGWLNRAAAYRRRESARINRLKCCPRSTF